MTNKDSRVIKFQDVRDRIIAELKKRGHVIGISESVTLLDGFAKSAYD
jgi:hypothetical protein